MRVLAFLLIFCAAAPGQTALHWKGLREDAAFESGRVEAGRQRQPETKRWMAGKSHWLADFGHVPSPADWRSLRERGLEVVSLVPDTGAILSGPATLRSSALVRVRRLLPDEKISSLISKNSDDSWFVVEFHPDVENGIARAIVLQEGLLMRENPYLASNHLLVEGKGASLEQLAEWDEVSYIFPASRDLIDGVPVYHCADDSSGSGTVGQSIPLVGDGWDGPGLGSAALSYAFYNVTQQLPSKEVAQAIASAFSQWSTYAAVSFTPTSNASGDATIGILFATGAHGDAYPFGPAGGVLAHTFYPYPVNPEPIAGDMHLNDANTWGIGSNVDLFSVALHEAGHALGLGHSDLPTAVMYPYYKQVTGLSAEDIGAVLKLYAAQTNPAPPASGPPASSSNPTASNPPAANPPASTPGGNSGTKDTAPPALQIVSPASTNVYTSNSSITLSGRASDNVGVAAVVWTTSIGGSGSASGTTQWVTAQIPLYEGINTITVLARDAAGNSTWRVVVVHRH